MKRCGAAFCLVALSLTIATPAMAADYDLVILNGRVMDPETMYDAVSNVGVQNGRIAAITMENWTHKFYASPVDFGGSLPGDQARKGAAPGAQPHIH